jgi:hypothetical protein
LTKSARRLFFFFCSFILKINVLSNLIDWRKNELLLLPI